MVKNGATNNKTSKSKGRSNRPPTGTHRGTASSKKKSSRRTTTKTSRSTNNNSSRSKATAATTATPITRRPPPPKDGLCNCRRLILITLSLFLFAVAGGITIWQVLPDKARETLRSVRDNGAPLVGTGLEDPAPLPPAYSFHQCNNAAGEGGSDDCCNGLPGLCSKRANEIMYAGVHNAQANLEDGFLIAPNHRYGVISALEYGYRVINLDMGVCDGKLVLFHGFCRLGTSDILDTFTAINDWMTRNPTETVLFPIQIDNSADGTVNLKHLYSVLQYAGNFTSRMAQLPVDEEWPTLGELVSLDKRALVFHYNSAGCTGGNCPETLHNWFIYAAETAFGNQDAGDFEDPDVCAITRGAIEAPIFALNAFVEIPSQALSGELLNTRDFLEQHIQECSLYNGGRNVNVVFIDYWFESDLPAVVQDHNRKLTTRRSLIARMMGL